MTEVYFNEFDPFAAQWLRNLYPESAVDERDIRQVDAASLAGFRRCHFFGGIAGWEYALELAGWGDAEVWTGSCPCQPFSDAGKRQAEADERHLWPAFLGLIAERRPPVVFGEQVASSLGREWLAGVRTDLEALEYAVGAADLCAAGVGAPHRRQRLYWVAYAGCSTRQRLAGTIPGAEAGKRRANGPQHGNCPERLGDGERVRTTGLADTEGARRRMVGTANERTANREGDSPTNTSPTHPAGLGDTTSAGPQEQWSEYRPSGERCRGLVGLAMQVGVPEWNGPTVAVKCSDGWRRVSAEPEAFPLATGVPKRMGKLRGAGNSIVPRLAAAFVRAFLEATEMVS
ncbi:MAG: DNA cytosine methyltransferase [Pirellulales bacterium]